MSNPYKENSEEYMNWEAGYSAQTESECPYESDDVDYRSFRVAWLKGFKSKNKGKSKPETQNTIEYSDISNLPDDLLEKELMRRKSKELEKLSERKQNMLQTLRELDQKINKLKMLCGVE